jgi:hypothetical protein
MYVPSPIPWADGKILGQHLESRGVSCREHFLGLKLSPPQIDLREDLALAELRGTLPSELLAIGLQPGRVELSSGLSPELECRVDQLVAAVVERLERWDYPMEPVVAAERTVDRLLSEGFRP